MFLFCLEKCITYAAALKERIAKAQLHITLKEAENFSHVTPFQVAIHIQKAKVIEQTSKI